MSEQPEFTQTEASGDSALEKIHPNRELWRNVLSGKGTNRDGTPRHFHTDEELRGFLTQIESAKKSTDKTSWQDWVSRYDSNGVPLGDLLEDLNAEIQRRLPAQAAAKTEAPQTVVAIEDDVGGNARIAEQHQLEELRSQLSAANLQIAKLTESNRRLLSDNYSMRQELEELKPKPDLQISQPKPAREGFLQRIFGERKPVAPVAEGKPVPRQTISAEPTREVRWMENMSPVELLELREKFVEGEAVTETGRRLKIGPFLKAGLIGVVYPAIDEQGRRCVVKLPAANLGEDALARFNEETTVIENFYKAWRRRYPNDSVPFPEVIKLASVRHSSKEPKGAFGLEWFPEESLLYSNLPGREEHGWEREVGLTAAALDYSRMLEVLNQDLRISCRDRKTTDFRLRDDRLIVLDWNVTRSVKPKDSNYGKLHPDDVYLFGALWYQMAVGRYPPAVINPLDENQWHEAVSYQMRFFLAKCLSPVVAERTSGSLVAETEEMQRRTNKAPEVLLEKGLEKLKGVKLAVRSAQEYLEQIRRLGGDPTGELKLPSVSDAQEALIYLDLARRRGLPDAQQSYQEAVLILTKNIPKLAIGEAAHHFSITQYDLMERGLKLLEPLSRGNPQLRLRWGRWKQLKQIGITAMQDGVGLREYREEIANIMGALEADEWLDDTKLTDARQRLAKVTAAIPDGQVKTLFGNLETEIILRQSLARVGQAEADGDFSQAALQAKRALGVAKDLRSHSDNPYLLSLSKFMPLDYLERETMGLEAMAKTQEGITRWRGAFEITKAEILTGVPQEFRQLDLVMLSRHLEALGQHLPETVRESLNSMREQLGTLRNLSFALESGDFDRATNLIDELESK